MLEIDDNAVGREIEAIFIESGIDVLLVILKVYRIPRGVLPFNLSDDGIDTISAVMEPGREKGLQRHHTPARQIPCFRGSGRGPVRTAGIGVLIGVQAHVQVGYVCNGENLLGFINHNRIAVFFGVAVLINRLWVQGLADIPFKRPCVLFVVCVHPLRCFGIDQ